MTGEPVARDDAGNPFTLVGRELPGFLHRRFIVLGAGEVLACGPGDWAGELLVLEHGRVELEHRSGQRIVLDERAVLALQETGVRAIRNAGQGSAVLALVRRGAGRRAPPG